MSDFKAKMHKIRFPQRLRPRPRWGSLAVFKGLSSKGKDGGRGRGSVQPPPPKIFWPRTAPGGIAGGLMSYSYIRPYPLVPAARLPGRRP